MRTGDYVAAVAAGARAAEVDRSYIAGLNPTATYPAIYATHNLDSLASAAMMAGQYGNALKAAQELAERVTPILADRPALEPLGARLMFVLLRFAKWNEVLALPSPSAQTRMLVALHHFGRGVAQASLGAVADAEKERDAFKAAKGTVPPDAQYGHNLAATVLGVADAVLEARLVAARSDASAAIAAWKQAVEAEDRVSYSEPSDWFYPTRESLGAALVRAKRYDEADLTFREDLERNPNNGRSLWGRWQALRASDGDVPGTQVIRRRFQDAWSEADTALRMEDF